METNEHAALGAAIERAFSTEPVAIGTAVSMAVTATLAALSQLGHIGGETMTVFMALATAWLPVIGYAIRANVTPYGNRHQP